MSNLILSTNYHKHDDNRLSRERGGLLLPVDPQTLATDWICSSCQVTFNMVHHMETYFLQPFANTYCNKPPQELTKSTDVEALEESFVKRFSHMPKVKKKHAKGNFS